MSATLRALLLPAAVLAVLVALVLPACKGDPLPKAVETVCTDGVDNDGDGDVDCWDTDCGCWESPETSCADGLDNDGDTFADCLDADCACGP